MSDLLAKLSLDSSKFKSDLKKSEQQAVSTGKAIKKALSFNIGTAKSISSITKLAASFGALRKDASSLATVFNRLAPRFANVASSASTSTAGLTAYTKTLRQANTATNSLSASTSKLVAALSQINGNYNTVNASTAALLANIQQITSALLAQAAAAKKVSFRTGSSGGGGGGSGGSGYGGQVMGAATSIVGFGASVQAMDSWTTLNNRIRLTTDSQKDFETAQKAILNTALQTGQALEGVGVTYQSLARSHKELGISQEQVAQLTNTISKAMVVGGGSAESNRAALVQLGQAFSSGVLRGEEFNSVMEQAPALAQIMARGLEVPVGALRKMAENGELTAERVTKALLKMSNETNEMFADVNLTISQSLQVLKTYFAAWIGGESDQTGAASRISDSLVLLGQNINLVANALTLFVGIKIVGFALSSAKSFTLMAASWSLAGRNAAAAAISTNGGAFAIGRATVAAWSGAAAVTSLSRAWRILAIQAKAAMGAMAPFAALAATTTAAMVALGSSIVAIGAAVRASKGESADNFISSMLHDVLGINQEIDSLGIKLYDFINSAKGASDAQNIVDIGVGFSPVGKFSNELMDFIFRKENAELKKRVKIEVEEKRKAETEVASIAAINIKTSADGISKEMDELAKNVGLSSNQIKINTELAKIDAELAKKGNNEKTVASLLQSKENLQNAQAAAKRAEWLEQEKKDADDRKKAAEQNIKGINDLIKQKELEAVQAGKTKDEMIKLQAAAMGATEMQQKHLASTQKLIDAQEKQAKLTEEVDKIIENLKTAGMTDEEKTLFKLKELGASEEQLHLANAQLEATKKINDAAELQKKSQEKFAKDLDKVASKLDTSATAMTEAVAPKETKRFSRWEQVKARGEQIRAENNARNAMSVSFGMEDKVMAEAIKKYGISTSKGGNVTQRLDNMIKKNTSSVVGYPNFDTAAKKDSENVGTINLNVANAKGIEKLFPLLGSIKTFKDLSDFIGSGMDSMINNGAMANA